MRYVTWLEGNPTAGQVTLMRPVSVVSWMPAGYYCEKNVIILR